MLHKNVLLDKMHHLFNLLRSHGFSLFNVKNLLSTVAELLVKAKFSDINFWNRLGNIVDFVNTAVIIISIPGS